MQNLQGKIAGYDFYSALEKLTDNAGLREFKDCYKKGEIYANMYYIFASVLHIDCFKMNCSLSST